MFTEQLTYLDEDVARVAFNKTNYEDLEFYKIKENDKDKIVWQILNVFNETALAKVSYYYSNKKRYAELNSIKTRLLLHIQV